MSEEQPIRVAIIDNDEDFFKDSMALLRKERDIQICASHLIKDALKKTASANIAANDVSRCQPNVLFLGQKVIREAAATDLKSIFTIRDKNPDMHIVIIEDIFVEEVTLIIIREGIRGFYKRKLGPSKIVSCVRNMVKGGIWMEEALISRVIEEFSRLYKHIDSLRPPTKKDEAKLSLLSKREMEILGLVSKSYTNEDIGKTLFISEKTVKTHIKNIFEKLGVKNRVEATLVLVRSGLAH
jgi:DNA-binding NarL/FixJ family response regulator